MAQNNHANAGSRAFAPALAQTTVPLYLFPYSLFARLLLAAFETLLPMAVVALLHLVDFYIFLLNLVSLRKRRGRVIPSPFSPDRPPSLYSSPLTWVFCTTCRIFQWTPSNHGLVHWTFWIGVGEHEPPLPKEGLSRCCCPALNAMANHSIIPRDGRRLTPHQVAAACSRTYNLSPTVCYALLAPFAHLWRQRGFFDLQDLSTQYMQHDGSLTREDSNSPFALPTVIATQGKPSQRLLLLYFPQLLKTLSIVKHARILSHRRQVSRQANGGFNLSPLQAIWSSFKSSLLHASIGHLHKDMARFLGANESGWELLPTTWEPATRSHWGITLIHLDFLTLLIELSAGSWSARPRRLVDYKGSESVHGWNPNLGECRNVE